MSLKLDGLVGNGRLLNMVPRYVIYILCLPLLVVGSGVSGLSAQEYFPWNSGLSVNQPAKANGNEPVLPGNTVQQPSQSDSDAFDNCAAGESEHVGSVAADSADARKNFSDYVAEQAQQLTSREGTASTIQVGLLLAALSLAPALVLMTTSYVRVVVVLSLLRQAFGAQQLPPTQVLTTLSLFLTLLIMAPVWNEIKTEAIDPYTDTAAGMEWKEAWHRGVVPIKRFMSRQIEAAQNGEAIAMFYKYLPEHSQQRPTGYEDVPLNVLLPAFMISELKVAFLLGFQIFLPFLVVDLVVSTVTVSMGMLMLPPTMVSFPLKLILFVMVDGWNLVVGMLLQSFGPVG
jgi:flagellar biosynthetic protein FliP